MVRLIFTQPDGEEQEVEAVQGSSVMQSAVGAGVPGIVAECGGNCVCATCHCYVDAAWMGRLPPPSAEERSLLECVWEPHPLSRLTCQIRVTPELDGLVLYVPLQQQ